MQPQLAVLAGLAGVIEQLIAQHVSTALGVLTELGQLRLQLAAEVLEGLGQLGASGTLFFAQGALHPFAVAAQRGKLLGRDPFAARTHHQHDLKSHHQRDDNDENGQQGSIHVGKVAPGTDI